MERYLGVIAQAARDASAGCETICIARDHGYEAIIEAFEEGTAT